MKKIIYLILISIVCSCSSSENEISIEPRTVRTAKAETASSESVRKYSFVSKPYKTSDLSFRVGGPVIEFDVQPGQFFRKGQVIAEIDSRDYIIACDRAKAIFEQAEAEYKRISSLYDKGNISGTAYEKAKSDYVQARTAYKSAQFDLNDTKLTAPFDGYIQDINIQRFQDVKPSYPVVSFIDVSKIKVEVYIPEDVAAYMRNNPSAGCEVTFGGMENKIFKPAETFISQSTTKNNISYLLTAVISNTENCLIGGMTGELSLPVRLTSVSSPVIVPQRAVVNRYETGTYVWRLNDGNTVEKTSVKTGKITGNNSVEIISGLNADDVIVTSGIHYLRENEKVNIL